MLYPEGDKKGRLRLVEEVGRSLLAPGDLKDAIYGILSRLGEALEVDRAYIFKNKIEEDTGKPHTFHYTEWVAEGVSPEINNSDIVDISYALEGARWYDVMIKGGSISGKVKNFPPEEQAILTPQGIKSLLAVPIIFKNVFWGFAGVDDCREEREWTEEDIFILSASSVLIGGALIREQTLEDLAQNEERWYKALESGGAAWVYDAVESRVLISKTGLVMLGSQAESGSFSLEHILNAVYEEDRASARDFFSALENNLGEGGVCEFRTGEKGDKWFAARGHVVRRGVFGETLRAVGSFTDITERKVFDNKLREALIATETANKAKSQFLAAMSREICKPLNGVIELLRLLKERIRDKDGREYLRIIRNGAGTLLNIVNSILDLSKAENGDISLDLGPCRLSRELEAIVRLFNISAYENNVYLKSFIDLNIPKVIKCDRLKIRQIVSNLLNNALKFTPPGGFIYFEARVANKTAYTVSIKFSVKDTGIGVDKKYIKDIFKPFTQADSSVSRKFGGSGLGLTIAWKFVELMNSRIEIESRLGKGSKFFFTLDFPIEEDGGGIFEKPPVFEIAFAEYPFCPLEPEGVLEWGGCSAFSFGTVKDLREVDISRYRAAVISLFHTDSQIISEIKMIRSKYPNTPLFVIAYPNEIPLLEKELASLKIMFKTRPFPTERLYKNILSFYSNEAVPGSETGKSLKTDIP